MALDGGCRCGAVRYTADVTEPEHHAVCHCADCRAASGAPMMAWLAVPAASFTVTSGEATMFEGPTGSQRHFCARCGTGLFFVNGDMLPGIVDIQSATLDDAATLPPAAQIQCAEQLDWITALPTMPTFDRYPG
ncbi:GFA family protein [Croceibacterium ferulae]|uniref:GFA family protein n=1 Tax=Croceibacterium ferulae TaxID=1854641 RepID=UPI000EB58113|nr:GFA family protein [Croceibacterium ferulae]